MSSSLLVIECPNLNCPSPRNLLGRSLCETCETPLIHRYLWAVGSGVDQIPIGEAVAERYYVVAPRIWLDTQPGRLPEFPTALPEELLPYLYLYPHRLHLPEAYGLVRRGEGFNRQEFLLLENAPIDREGQPCPALTDVWPKATPTRQLYWLWQLLQLWEPMTEQGVSASLLVADNLRVEGWRVRLRELFTVQLEETLTLADLGSLWLEWVPSAHSTIAGALRTLCQQMQQPNATLSSTAARLNRLLLEQAAELPLKLNIVGISDTGPQRSHNEDACYPNLKEQVTLPGTQTSADQALLPYVAIVCDGIGGHEGGEVASQMAIQSLKLQMRAFLAEVAEQDEPIAPELVVGQLEAAIRVVNNLIASLNDTQGRESRQRMGTTLVMAVQLPQRLPKTSSAASSTHELYLAHVGDSRAYWLTAHYCHQLTVDDDVSARETRLGRALYREALERSDAGALTQALGTRGSEILQPTVQRFILEEDGILLLCSDGLSDHGWLEQSWRSYVDPVLAGRLSLDWAAQSLLELANQKNGYDNTSIVLLHCQVSPELPQLFEPPQPAPLAVTEPPLSESARALLYGETLDEEETPVVESAAARPQRSSNLLVGLSLVALLLIGGSLGLIAWWQANPQGMQPWLERLPLPGRSPAAPR